MRELSTLSSDTPGVLTVIDSFELNRARSGRTEDVGPGPHHAHVPRHTSASAVARHCLGTTAYEGQAEGDPDVRDAR